MMRRLPCSCTSGSVPPLYLDFATMWDQYKTQLPLILSLYPEHGRDVVNSLLVIRRRGLGDALVSLPAVAAAADEASSVVDSPDEPTATTNAVANSSVGNYPITLGGGVDDNYDFTYVNANLAITKANLTVTADNQARTYGAANPALTFTYSGFLNGDRKSVV